MVIAPLSEPERTCTMEQTITKRICFNNDELSSILKDAAADAGFDVPDNIKLSFERLIDGKMGAILTEGTTS